MSAVAAPATVWRERWPTILAFAGTVTVVAGTASAQGGYFPTSWGWMALALAWMGAIAIVLGPPLAVTKAAALFVGAFVAFAGWIALSLLWTASPSQTPLEVERSLVYVAGVIVAVLAATRLRPAVLAGAVVSAVTLVCLYSLGTRLFPDRLGVYDPTAGYRLSEPIGYWNGLAAFAAIGTVLALGLAARGTSIGVRAAGGAAVPVLVTTIYFAFGRGAWIALFFGLAFLLAVDTRRLQLLAAALVPSAAAAATIAVAFHQPALTHARVALGASSSEGRHVAGVLVLAAFLSAGGTAWVATLGRRVEVDARARRAITSALCLVVAAALTTAFVHYGDPVTLGSRAAHRFAAPPPNVKNNLNARLFTVLGNGRWQEWQVAWRGWQDRPALGLGAGGYERYWIQHRSYDGSVRDAHNLYLEVLAELGPLGLVLLLAAVAVPLVAGIRHRRRSLAPALTAAWLVYTLHAAGDWDWELPAVGLPAILCAAVLVTRGQTTISIRRPLLGGSLAVVGLLALGGLASNLQLGRATAAIQDGHTAVAVRDARRAATWAPWSAEPWRRLAEAYAQAGRNDEARSALLKAVAHDDGNWKTWYALAQVSTDTDRDRAFAEAKRLNPFVPPLGV